MFVTDILRFTLLTTAFTVLKYLIFIGAVFFLIKYVFPIFVMFLINSMTFFYEKIFQSKRVEQSDYGVSEESCGNLIRLMVTAYEDHEIFDKLHSINKDFYTREGRMAIESLLVNRLELKYLRLNTNYLSDSVKDCLK